MSPSDEDLLNSARTGSQDALVTLLQKHSPAVRTILASEIPFRWRLVLCVDDLLQETYVDAFLNIGKFTPNGEGSFRAWLLAIG